MAMAVTNEYSLLHRQLKVALATMLICSLLCGCCANVYELMNGDRSSQEVPNDLESCQFVGTMDPAKSLTDSTKSSQKTVVINTGNTLVPSMAEKIDLAPEIDSETPIDQDMYNTFKQSSMGKAIQNTYNTETDAMPVLLPESQFSNEQLQQESDSSDDINANANYRFPKPDEAAKLVEDCEVDLGDLDNLSDIPEKSMDKWPLFSTGSEMPSDQQPSTNEKHNIKHISLDSWNRNYSRWKKNRERTGYNSGIFTSTSKINDGMDTGTDNLLQTKAAMMMLRSVSDNISNKKLASIPNLPPPSSPSRNCPPPLSSDILDNQYQTIYGSQDEDKDNMNSIVAKSFCESYESISRMSSPTKMHFEAQHSSRVSASASIHTTSARSKRDPFIQYPMLRSPSLKHQKSFSVFSSFSKSAGSSPQRISRSLHSSPLHRLRSLRFSSRGSGTNVDPFIPRQCSHSQSVPSLNFEFVKSLQASPQHHRAMSSLTGQNLARTHHALRKSRSKLRIIENAGKTNLVVEGDNDSSCSSLESQNEWLQDEEQSQKAVTPPDVIGEYDREKWRVICKKKSQQALSA